MRGITEQEITGDVLLDLDVNLLKSEIGIMAFGKRMRISNAIADLRRPPSITYSDHHPLQHTHQQHQHQHQQQQVFSLGGEAIGLHTPISPQSQIHSRTQSQSHSHHSFPNSISASGGGGGGGGGGHVYSQSIQSSLASPLGSGGGGFGVQQQNVGGQGNGLAPHALGQLIESPSSVGGEYVNVGNDSNMAGLGISDGTSFLVRLSFHHPLLTLKRFCDYFRNLVLCIWHYHHPMEL